MKKYDKIITKRFLIKEYIIKKKSMKEIALNLNCSHATIRNYLIKFNIKIRKQKKVCITKNELEKLYLKDRISSLKIAKIFNCSSQTIQDKLHKYKISIIGSKFLIGRKLSESVKIKIRNTRKKRNYVGKNSSNWRGGPIKVGCNHCHKVIEIERFELKRDNHFCNRECFAKWQRKNLLRKNNPSFRKGRPKCILCKKEISYNSIYCLHCKNILRPKISKYLLVDKYLKKGISVKKIASELKCKNNLVYRKLKKYNIKKPLNIYFCIDCNKKISDENHKRCQDCYGIFNKGENSPNFRHGETLKKHYCIDCNKKINYYSFIDGGKRCRSCSKKGRLNQNWKDGISKLPYSFDFDENLKEKIRERDKYICQNCDMTEEEHLIVYGSVLNIHHIDYDKKNYKEDNLITVCKQCNTRANYNRNFWREYFRNKIKSILIKIKR